MPDGSTKEQIDAKARELAEDELSVTAEEFSPPTKSDSVLGRILDPSLLPMCVDVAARNRAMLAWMRKTERIKE